MFLAQEKALYQSLNMMKTQSGGLIGYFWAPTEFESKIQMDLAAQTATKISSIKDNYHIEPPTYNKTTDFTYVSQMIVDTYGVPCYQEANPTPVSIVTFPFLFGMMFGDMGHGSILCMFGLFLTLRADKLKDTAFGGLLPARYFLLLMGFSSFYCGFMYNEYFALTIQIFQSCYHMGGKE